MDFLIQQVPQKIFDIPKLNMVIYMDVKSNLYYTVGDDIQVPLLEMPWEYQKEFFFKFLHDWRVSEKLKELEPIGAINTYIMAKYYLRESIAL